MTPIYKTGDELECGNYRPISLLCNINRLFEKLIFNRVKAFITKHDLLCSSQYGFRQNHSTEHALLDIVSKIQTYMDKNLLLWHLYWFTKALPIIGLIRFSQEGIREPKSVRNSQKKERVIVVCPKGLF